MKLFSVLVALFCLASIGNASDCPQNVRRIVIEEEVEQPKVRRIVVREEVQYQPAFRVEEVRIDRRRVVQRPVVQRSFSFSRMVVR